MRTPTPRLPQIMPPDRGPFITTYPSRTRFYVLDPRPEEVLLLDVAHHLSNLCRFTGGVREHYSVGQHCVLGSGVFVDPKTALGFLFHDATEAYLNDLPSPLKHSDGLSGYRTIEGRVAAAVNEAFGVEMEGREAAIKRVDRIMFNTEDRDLRGRTDFDDGDNFLSERITPWSPAETRTRYLERYFQLVQQIGK